MATELPKWRFSKCPSGLSPQRRRAGRNFLPTDSTVRSSSSAFTSSLLSSLTSEQPLKILPLSVSVLPPAQLLSSPTSLLFRSSTSDNDSSLKLSNNPSKTYGGKSAVEVKPSAIAAIGIADFRQHCSPHSSSLGRKSTPGFTNSPIWAFRSQMATELIT